MCTTGQKTGSAIENKGSLSMEQLRIGHQSLVVSQRGSVLGPVLFIIYINDIDVELNNFIRKFADDTKI